jgi:hypothetical protein
LVAGGRRRGVGVALRRQALDEVTWQDQLVGNALMTARSALIAE